MHNMKLSIMTRLENIEQKMAEIAKLSKQITTLAKREYGEGAHLAVSEGDTLILFSSDETTHSNVVASVSTGITPFTW